FRIKLLSRKMFKLMPTCVILLFSIASLPSTSAAYNVVSFGAKPDGQSDSTLPFLRAWMAACNYMKRSKIDEKSEKYVFIGYDSRSKGYKLYNPSNGKIVVSRGVVFDEESAWEWNIPQESYNTFPFLDVEEQEDDDMERVISPPSSPEVSIQEQASPTSSESPPRRTRSLRHIYEETEEIQGTLVAPWDYRSLGNSGFWILFQKVSRLTVSGGGTVDGRGAGFWACRRTGSNCPYGTRSITFLWCNNIVVSGLTSIKSQLSHFAVARCNNLRIQNVRIIAPSNSPNTDDIIVQDSTGVTISRSIIRTGDDCIAIGPNTKNVWIERIGCGTDMASGSLGNSLKENGVQDVMVKNSVFTKTDNGVLIKSWARASNSYATNINFRNLILRNLANPILIDQTYCPNNQCPHQDSTGVTISCSIIRTGDDCIAIGPNTKNVWIERIGCGPGHGISIGSLGNSLNENGVQNVTVTNSVFTKTDNGVRIKSWARASNSYATNINFRNLIMRNVANPILIDQTYCPNNQCPHQVNVATIPRLFNILSFIVLTLVLKPSSRVLA
ncbi:hypothetical protein RJ639_015033, partial [Escallonia herrerae]